MTKNKKNTFKAFNKDGEGFTKKKKISFLIIIIIATSIIISCLSIVFTSQLYDNEDEITWGLEEGDLYYFKLSDSYYESDGELINEFAFLLKSEILEIGDLDVDWDDDDDLLIMSSFIFGDEDFYSIEFPNWFDFYTFLISSYNFDQMENYADNFPNVTNLVQWALPNAIHIQCSSLYHHIHSMIDKYYAGEYIDIEYGNFWEFPPLYKLLNHIILDYNLDDDFEEDFESYSLGVEADLFTIITEDNENNTAIISEDPADSLNNIWNITLDSNKSLRTEFNLYNYFVNKTEIGDSLNLEEYWYKAKNFSIDLEFNDINNMDQEFQIQFGTDIFNLTANVGETLRDFEGSNGINIKITDGVLQYFIGDYIWDGFGVRQSLSHEKGWNNFSPSLNISKHFGAGGDLIPKQNRFTLDFTINENNPYLFDLSIIITDLSISLWDFSDYSLSIDCPYDYLQPSCYDNDKEDYTVFRFNNYTNFILNITKENDNKSVDLIDNIEINGNLYYLLEDFENILHDFFFSQLLLFSEYHTMFFPKEFSWDDLTSISEIINDLCELLFGFADFITISEDSDSLFKMEISYNAFDNLREYMKSYLLDNFAIQSNGFIEGDTDIKIVLEFDKELSILNESYIKFRYNDLDISRELKMKLVAISDEDGNQRSEKFPAIYSSGEIEGMINSQISNGFTPIFILGFASSGIVFGLSETIRVIVKRRKRK
jgi:hypothetical protein